VTDPRPPRLSREEIRTLLLAAGREAVLDEGVETGSSNLTFKRVFERLEKQTGIHLTNASVIRRVWENLADYQADVLVSIAKDQGRPEVGGAVDAIGALVADLDLSTPESRARAMRQVCRVGGAASSRAIAQSSNWTLWVSVVSMSQSMADQGQRRRIKEALGEGYTHVYTFWSDQFLGLTQLLGYRTRPPWTLEQLTMSVTAFSEGCSIKQRISDHIEVMTRPTGPDGEDQEWTLFAVGLEALVNEFLEPDPGFTPHAP